MFLSLKPCAHFQQPSCHRRGSTTVQTVCEQWRLCTGNDNSVVEMRAASFWWNKHFVDLSDVFSQEVLYAAYPGSRKLNIFLNRLNFDFGLRPEQKTYYFYGYEFRTKRKTYYNDGYYCYWVFFWKSAAIITYVLVSRYQTFHRWCFRRSIGFSKPCRIF